MTKMPTQRNRDAGIPLLSADNLVSICIHPLTSTCITLPVCITALLKNLSLLSVTFDWFLQVLLWISLLVLIGISIVLFVQMLLYLNTLLRPSKARDFHNDLALITGGSSGIGWGLVNELASRGCKVAIVDIVDPEQVHSVALESIGRVKFFKCDITDSDELTEVLGRVETEFGEISILVNNAGICSAKSIVKLSELDIKRTFEVNILSHFGTVKHVLPKMITSRSGHIVTVASTMGLTAVADMTDYCASKYAVIGFHEALRQEINRLPFAHRIQTTLLCPGLILTGMFHGIKLKFPFLNPPLLPEQVVYEIVKSLESVPAPDDSWFSSGFKQHKVIWIPYAYYFPVLLNIMAPPFLSDWIKSYLGGNSAITETFVGRSKKRNE